jgi:hypothetical protein
MNPFILILLITNLLFVHSSFSKSYFGEKFVFSTRYFESPKEFKSALKRYLTKIYESEQPINVEEILELVKKCNPDLSMRDPQTYRYGFDVCMDFYYFNLWAGLGNFSMTYTQSSNRKITIDGGASFIGGQIHFPHTLSSRIILEGKYWYLPELATSDSISQDLKEASLFQTNLSYQKRFMDSDWSYRFGVNLTKSPIIKNLSESILVENIDLNYQTVLSAGPLIGYKYAFDRSRWIKHLAHIDFTPMIFADGKFFNQLEKNFSLRLGYKYFIHKRWALTLDIEKNQTFTNDDVELENTLYGLGLQLYTF